MSKIGDKDVASGELDSMLNGYTLLDSLRNRRSRHFAMGMKTEIGPWAYTSQHSPCPLSEREEAALVYAACGITGYALGDLVYAKGEGGTMMGGMIGRTVPSPDAVCAAYPTPYRTVNALQVSHLDLDFFDTFYRPEMLSDTQRQHMKHWHGDDEKE